MLLQVANERMQRASVGSSLVERKNVMFRREVPRMGCLERKIDNKEEVKRVDVGETSPLAVVWVNNALYNQC